MSYYLPVGINEDLHAQRIAARNVEDKARIARGEAPLYSSEAQHQERRAATAAGTSAPGTILGMPTRTVIIAGGAIAVLAVILVAKKKKKGGSTAAPAVVLPSVPA